jgi:hypothetical protein
VNEKSVKSEKKTVGDGLPALVAEERSGPEIFEIVPVLLADRGHGRRPLAGRRRTGNRGGRDRVNDRTSARVARSNGAQLRLGIARRERRRGGADDAQELLALALGQPAIEMHELLDARVARHRILGEAIAFRDQTVVVTEDLARLVREQLGIVAR